MAKLGAYLRLVRADKPIGTFLVLWPTLWGLWIASHGQPKLNVLLVFIGGVILMRAAGCVINDIADRHIDGHVSRTKQRPLVSGEISVLAAGVLFVILCLCALALVLLMNPLTIALSVGAVLIAAIYPFCKRFFHAPQLILGTAFAWAIPMAFAAQTNHVPAITWPLFISVVCWVIAYDTMYAMVDRDDDKKLPIKSSALWFGQYDKWVIALLQLACLLLWGYIGDSIQASWAYYLALSGAAGLFSYQQWLIRQRQPKKCFTAFLNNNYVGFLLFIGLFIHFY